MLVRLPAHPIDVRIAALSLDRSVQGEVFTTASSRAAFRCRRLLQEEWTMGILGWIVFGLVIGALAKLLMPGKDPGGIIVTMLLGIVGSVLGGFVGQTLGLYGPGDAAGFVMSLLGAILLLVIYRMATGNRRTITT